MRKLIVRLYGEIDWRSGSSDWTTKVQGLQDHRSAFAFAIGDTADNQELSLTAVMGNTKSNLKVVKSQKTVS
jgi:hypothetical protein